MLSGPSVVIHAELYHSKPDFAIGTAAKNSVCAECRREGKDRMAVGRAALRLRYSFYIRYNIRIVKFYFY